MERPTEPIRITRSTGNVFRDVGFSGEEAEHLRIRADLMIALQKEIEARGLTQAAAAEIFGVHPPRVSDLVRGRIERFSIDTLVDMLVRMGAEVRMTVRAPGKRTRKIASG